MFLGMSNRGTFREIEARELAMPLLGGSVIGERGLYFRFKKPEINLLITWDLDSCFVAIADGAYTLEVATIAASIATIFLRHAEPYVGALIIKTVAVSMIYMTIARRVQYQAAHEIIPHHFDFTVYAPVNRTNRVYQMLIFSAMPGATDDDRRIFIVKNNSLARRHKELSHVG